MKCTLLTGALLLAGYATAVPMIPSQPYSEGYVSPMYSAPDADILKDSYIVVLKDNLHPTKIEEHTSWVAQLTNNNSPWTQWLHPSSSSHGVRHVYDRPTLKGYSGKFDSATLNAIRASEDVSTMERLLCWPAARRIIACLSLPFRSIKNGNYNSVLTFKTFVVGCLC